MLFSSAFRCNEQGTLRAFLSGLHCFQGLMAFRDCEAYEPAYQTILRITFLFYQVNRVYLGSLIRLNCKVPFH